MSKASDCRARPILMSDPMARAIQDRRKTQTRRLIKGIRCKDDIPLTVYDADAYNEIIRPATPVARVISHWTDADSGNVYEIACPYGKVDDILWVRETWATDPWDGAILYRADHTDEEWRQMPLLEQPIKWSPSLMMPHDDSRACLRITRIDVERLQDISAEDAIAEGVDGWEGGDGREVGWTNYMWHGHPGVTRAMERGWPYQYSSYSDVRDAYSSLIARISGADTWLRNPWVWVITYEIL